jgi:primosomal protein N' (replication factor Y)
LTVIVADVVVPVAVDTAYSYRVPDGLALAPGDLVTVPLGTRETTGVVFELRESAAGGNLRPVSARHDMAALQPALRAFVDWVARWTLSPRGMVLRMAIRASDDVGDDAPRIAYRLKDHTVETLRMTPARARVLAVLADGHAHHKKVLADLAACSAGVIDALVDAGAIEAVALPPAKAPAPDADFDAPTLGKDQRVAASQLADAVAAKTFSVSLLDGVTGSGKTEVYFEAVAQALREGGQALVMMPEIALTAQFLDRFAARFGVRPAEWHSGVASRRRARLWTEVANGETRVVVGARSALFLPFRELRLIVVDEEHEAAYKQDDGVSYHARDMAVVRGRLEQAAVVLASATPSIESRVNAGQGRYRHLALPGRHGGRTMPVLSAIDLRRDAPPRGQWISTPLRRAVADTIEAGEQALLFLNRRGYAPLTLCRACGHRFQCPDCTAWLVEHRFRRALVCHHCGHIERRPDICPECGTADSLVPCGPGVERLAEEVATLFPDARVLTLSSDHPGGIDRLRRELAAIADGDYDIVIGTQLVAKGHNFPSLTLVGVVDADVGLSSADPRAAERTFQLLQQVTGRAGRGERPGRGLIQTWQPEHPVIAAILSGDREAFYREETEVRRRANLPPFGRLAALIVSATDRGIAEAHARAIVRAAHDLPPESGFSLATAGGAPRVEDIDLLGPAEAPIAMVRGRHRVRLLLRAPRGVDMQGFLRAVLAQAPKPTGNLRVTIDIEPQNFL